MAEEGDEVVEGNLEGFGARSLEAGGLAIDGEASEAAGVHETHFGAGFEGGDGVCVLFDIGAVGDDEHASGHAEVDDPLPEFVGGVGVLEVDDDLLADAADGGDARAFYGFGD